MRKIPVELTKRYVEKGWWTQDTLGDLIARGLEASPDAGFRVHSDVRPFAGTFHDVEIEARRLAAGSARAASAPATWSHYSCRIGWRPPRRSGIGVPRRRDCADRALLRAQGLGHILGTAKPRVFITAEEFGA